MYTPIFLNGFQFFHCILPVENDQAASSLMEWIDGVKRDLFKDICIIFRLFPADEERKLRRYCPLSAGPKIIVVKLSANPGMLEQNDCNDVVTELHLMGERASSQQYQNISL